MYYLIAVPPEKPVIMDLTGREVGRRLGPYKEGESVVVTCSVLGGRPSPTVTWWRWGLTYYILCYYVQGELNTGQFLRTRQGWSQGDKYPYSGQPDQGGLTLYPHLSGIKL